MPGFFDFSDPNIDAKARAELLFQRALLTDRLITHRHKPYLGAKALVQLTFFSLAVTAVFYEMLVGVFNVHNVPLKSRLGMFLKIRSDVSNFFPEMYLREIEADYARVSQKRKDELNIAHWH